MRKFFTLLIIFPIIFMSNCMTELSNKTPEKEFLVTNETYTDNVNGYYFNYPAGFEIDKEFYPKTTRFVSSDTTIEVYMEECETKDKRLSYIGYSNQAITNNKTDYFNVKEYTDEDYNSVLTWSRNKLSRINNDKNHYLKIDIPKEDRVYTILVKSTEPKEDYLPYLEMIGFHNNFEEFKTTEKKKPINKKYNQETQEFYNTYFSPENDLEWGIFQPDYLTEERLYNFENDIEHKFKILLWYTSFHKEYDPSRVKGFLEKAYSEDRIVELTLQHSLTHDAGNELFKVLDGYYDEFLDAYAKDVAEFDHPVLFRFANEMNGDWCEYSAYQMSLDTELYRELYAYVYSFFEKYEADNVIWVWNPNGKSFPNFTWNAEEMYYPEDKMVDVLGLTLYNTGTFYEGENWTSFEDLYFPLYENCENKYDMPYMITEFSCARVGGDKEKWTENMFEKIKDLDKIKIAVWWNGADYTPDGEVARAYFIDDSKEMAEIFKTEFKN